jgi:peptidoglycan/LPS O-acetylase OafA/YrhL
MDAWHMFKWIWAAVLLAYFVVQIIALRRLDGEPKRQSTTVLMVMLVFTMLQSWVQDVFENREASRIGMAVVGVYAVIATVVLSRMLHKKVELKSGLSR